MKKIIVLIFLFSYWLSPKVMAQRTELVSETDTLEVSEDDDITLKEAKERCIQRAKNKAIKKIFGERVSASTIIHDEDINGKGGNSISSTDIITMSLADWKDVKDPEINVEYINGKLFFTANVYGEATERTSAKTELICEILKNDAGKKIPAKRFNYGERIYIKFRAPMDGYLAVYLLEGNKLENKFANCLLPYPDDSDGKFEIKNGKNYILFDLEEDSSAKQYKLSTKQSVEYFQLILLFSPNPFVKCNDESRDRRHPNAIKWLDFQKWLKRFQQQDRDLIIKEYEISVTNNQ